MKNLVKFSATIETISKFLFYLNLVNENPNEEKCDSNNHEYKNDEGLGSKHSKHI